MSVDRAVLFRLATSDRFERVVRAAPTGEQRAWRAASRYVAGTSFADAAGTARRLAQRGVGSSIDLFGESVQDSLAAEQVAEEYRTLARELGSLPESVWLSVDLSHLGLDTRPLRCREHLTAIAAALPPGRRIQVGAEDYARADAVLDCVLGTAAEGLVDQLGATVQANFHRSPTDLERLLEAGVHVRLVKGAYLKPANRALPYGEPTDI
ncbi:MAG TPA: proline dehydrogenase family protein, partial [Nocardioidaceae bacterium]|nr:proline dehydrogenase family protein [Nocardioidaceae bacterium]